MSFRLPEPVVDRLLANDDSFHALFTRNARGALASIGFEPAADPDVTDGLWRCITVQDLASKEAIRAGIVELRLQFAPSAVPLMPWKLPRRRRTALPDEYATLEVKAA